jgi:23S rRNA (guanosine2251-2'-O)-methyltransferase
VRELLCVEPTRAKCLFCVDHRERGADPVAALVDAARARGIEVSPRTRADLDQLCGGGQARHQGVVAIADEIADVDVDDLLARAEARGMQPLLVALDGVEDPHNLGAIIRSTLVLGGDGLLLPKDRAARVTPVVTKASAGASERLPLVQVTNLVRALEDLKQKDVWLVGVAASPAARPLWELDADRPLCLVLGGEGRGLGRLIARTCDFLVEIPMVEAGVGSLNVSVAAGAALYEIARQRSG